MSLVWVIIPLVLIVSMIGIVGIQESFAMVQIKDQKDCIAKNGEVVGDIDGNKLLNIQCQINDTVIDIENKSIFLIEAGPETIPNLGEEVKFTVKLGSVDNIQHYTRLFLPMGFDLVGSETDHGYAIINDILYKVYSIPIHTAGTINETSWTIKAVKNGDWVLYGGSISDLRFTHILISDNNSVHLEFPKNQKIQVTWQNELSPYSQVQIGIPKEDVICRGLIKITSPRDIPTCVKQDSIPTLIRYGWYVLENYSNLGYSLDTIQRQLTYNTPYGKLFIPYDLPDGNMVDIEKPYWQNKVDDFFYPSLNDVILFVTANSNTTLSINYPNRIIELLEEHNNNMVLHPILNGKQTSFVVTDSSHNLKIDISKGLTKLRLGGFITCAGMPCGSNNFAELNNVDYDYLFSPEMQIKHGILPNDVMCDNDLILYVETYTSKPTCLEKTAVEENEE